MRYKTTLEIEIFNIFCSIKPPIIAILYSFDHFKSPGSSASASFYWCPLLLCRQTALAAAILSAVANGDRVLAVAPSHAAVDALTRSIVTQWPTNFLGDPMEKVIRLKF